VCCVGRETRFGLTSCVPLRIGNVGTRASLTFVRRAGGESPLLVADWIVLHSITCVPLRLHSGAVSRFSCALDSGRFPMRLNLGALNAFPSAVGFGRAQRDQMLTCLSLGMLNGRGGAVREFPSRSVSFRLIWACFSLCGWIWARSAGPKLRGEVVACIGLGALNVRGWGGGRR
jgi:hypothetical protein